MALYAFSLGKIEKIGNTGVKDLTDSRSAFVYFFTVWEIFRFGTGWGGRLRQGGGGDDISLSDGKRRTRTLSWVTSKTFQFYLYLLIWILVTYLSVSTFLWQQEEGKDPALVSHQPESFYFWNFGIFICVFVFWGEQGPCVFISDLEFVFAYFYS